MAEVIGNGQSGLRHSTTDNPGGNRRSTSLWAKDPASDSTTILSNSHSAGFNEVNAENKGVTIESSPINDEDTGHASVIGDPIYYDNMVPGVSAVNITSSNEELKWDYTPFVATEDYHVATKKYVDDSVTDRIQSPNGQNTVIAGDNQITTNVGNSNIDITPSSCSMQTENAEGNISAVQMTSSVIKTDQRGPTVEFTPTSTAREWQAGHCTFRTSAVMTSVSTPVVSIPGSDETHYSWGNQLRVMTPDEFNPSTDPLNNGIFAEHVIQYEGGKGNPFIATHDAHITTKKYVDDNNLIDQSFSRALQQLINQQFNIANQIYRIVLVSEEEQSYRLEWYDGTVVNLPNVFNDNTTLEYTDTQGQYTTGVGILIDANDPTIFYIVSGGRGFPPLSQTWCRINN